MTENDVVEHQGVADGTGQAVTASGGALRRTAATGYLWLLLVFLLAGAVQIFLAGLGAYFCILEALQNVAKYERATRATVALACPDGQLEFSVTDDGVGFDTAAIGTGPDGTGPRGTGLQGMADRLAAAGGSFRIRSGPGLGTTVRGTLPA